MKQGDRYPRNKATALRAGFTMNELSKLHAILSNQKKKAEKAIEAVAKAQASVDYYWERVFDALDQQEETG